MPTFQNAFISYGRKDSKSFSIALKERLKAQGIRQIWLDLDDIPSGTDWQQRIDDAIERSHSFIYVISPAAISSAYCRIELALAISYGKRIIPLMHVEVGDFQPWEQQDPKGCTTIRQLNWISYREGQDDPDIAFRKLCHVLQCCDEKTGQEKPHIKAYLHQHTTLLTQALAWERHHRQSRYLLVGSERQNAEAWLQTPFDDDEPLPCTPIDLQCEFITESTKNANNLMTQVFLCHAEADRDAAEQIRRSLLRRGITVWNYRTDIQTSQDYNSAITQGIEEADNTLFLLSPHSAQSPYCQQELQQALDLHKRIIPVLAAPTAPELVPESLRPLQYVDLTDNTQEADYLADESQLLKLLNTDAAYHSEHKTWLVQALKWQRQQQNPTLLLRGYNLRRAENWLKVARTHRHPPTELHDQFIAESLRQPPDSSLDVFISYSRVDSDFARRLNEALQIQGKRTWFDQESIATGTDFQQEIYRGIESSDVFVFVLSPQSVNSPFCADEVEYAHSLNKRMVTVLHRPIDTADLHPVLAKLQWLDFRDHDGDFQANFVGLLRTLDTDREHLETHTRLLLRAGEWDRKGRDESLLLRGQELKAAENWLGTYAEIEPKPTGLQQEYIRAGRAKQEAQAAAEKKLRRGALIGAIAAIAGISVAAISGGVAWYWTSEASKSTSQAKWNVASAAQRERSASRKTFQAEVLAGSAVKQAKQAQRDQQQAEAKAEDAEIRASEADSKAQSAAVAQQQAEASAQAAEAKARDADKKTAAAERERQLAQDGTRLEQDGITALNRLDFDAVGALLRALKASKNLNEMAAKERLKAISNYPAASPVLALQQIQSRIAQDRLLAYKKTAKSVAFSPDGQRIVTVSEDGSAQIWQAKTGNVIDTLKGEGGKSWVNSVVFSPDGLRVLTLSRDFALQVWQAETRTRISVLKNSEYRISSSTFSPDGQRVVTTSHDGKAQVWHVETGDQIATLESPESYIRSAAFSPDGQRVVTTSADRTARVWHVETETQIAALAGPGDDIRSAAFSPDGQWVVIASGDGTARVWHVETETQIAVLEGHRDIVTSATFSPDGQRVVTTSADGTARVWQAATGVEIVALKGLGDWVTSAAFSPNGQQVVTASSDGKTWIWQIETNAGIATLADPESRITQIALSPDGQRVVTLSENGTVRVRQAETGAQIAVLADPDPESRITQLELSPSNQRIVTLSENGTVRIWQAETGAQIAVLADPESRITQIALSPDGQRVVTKAFNNTLRVWQVTTGTEIVNFKSRQNVNSMAFSPNGQRVVTTSWGGDHTVRVWQAETGAEIALLKGHWDTVDSAAFSPDGQRVVTASWDDTARVWNAESGISIAILKGHTDNVYTAAFSPDGQRVVTASSDGTARVWQATTGSLIAVLEGHASFISSAVFSPDGQQVVTTSGDSTTRVWDLKGRQLAIYEGKSGVLSSDGQRVATVVGGRVKVYDIETLPELITWGCQWLDNYLKYGQATDSDRALCGLPPRPDETDDTVQFQSSLGQAVELVQVSWLGLR